MLLLTVAYHGLVAETERVPPGIGIDEKLGQPVASHLPLWDESGKEVSLLQFLDRKRPLILVPSYYTCVRLCSFIFQGLRRAADIAAANGMLLGRDYRIVSLSFHPQDNPKTANEKGNEIRSQFRHLKVTDKEWHFLTGEENHVRHTLASLGYRYRPDPNNEAQTIDFSHTAALALVSPQGKIMRYLYGVQFPDREFRLSLVEAANGKIGSAFEKILLYCFRYDAKEGKYTPFAWAFMRIGGGLTILFLLSLWGYLLYSRRRNSKIG